MSSKAIGHYNTLLCRQTLELLPQPLEFLQILHYVIMHYITSFTHTSSCKMIDPVQSQANKLQNTLGGQVTLIGIAIYTGHFRDHQIHLEQIELHCHGQNIQYKLITSCTFLIHFL